MKIKIILFLLLSTYTFGIGQDSFFLDSLFKYDFSEINKMQLQAQKSEIDKLEHDWGLSLGTNITNSFQEEIDAGLSTRIYAKADMLSGGFYGNTKQTEIIHHQIKIDSIQGIQRALDNNYGVYYNYIIYLYNQEKIKLCDSIVFESSKLTDYYQNLYYNKLIEFEEILASTNTHHQYNMLQEAQISYNNILEKMLSDTLLPVINTQHSWEIDFEGLYNQIEHDSSSYEALLHTHEIIDIQYLKDKTPNLSLAVGYDISRHRPYFGVSFNMDIKTHQKQNIENKKQQASHNHYLANLQSKKEITNLQYEYQFKEKQLRGLHFKLQKLDEEERKYQVRQSVLSLSESIAYKKISLNRKLVQYEMTDLRQQQMLLLLRLKKNLHNIQIGPFVKIQKNRSNLKKYAGNRYLMVASEENLGAFNIHILLQNEIKPILPSEIIDMVGIQIINPDNYETRAEMEIDIAKIMTDQQINNFLIESLESLKQLELRTIQQRNFDITSLDN